MKRIFIILLTLVLLLGICPMSALAETGGSGNVDGGGGDMGQGTSQNSWNPGMDGVRITVVDAESGQPVSSSFDLTNKSPSIKVHFGKVSKIQYANGASISPTTGNYDYYTDVITPVTLYAGSEINPDSPATVSFTINGSTYRMNNIVIPSGDSQIAWVKWHTPSEPQDITIYVSTNKGSLSQSTIQAKVVDLSGNDPPDPKATDTMGSWTASSVPSRETKTYAAWSVWWARWHPYWVWHSTGDDDGYWVDEGWYDFFRDNYSASMTATTRIEPDEKVPTASGDLMKSGYGVTNTVTATVSTSAPLSHYTYGQTAVSYFPEFGYGTYWRLLERLTSGTTARFQFAKNIYSTYNQRVHFTPVWFPDGSYTVNTHVMDIWTPAGMLAMNLTDDVTISGSLYDDWHIAPGNP